MGYDFLSPISLAQLNVLCVPTGQVNATRYEEYIRALRAFSILSSRALTAIPNTFSFKDGSIILNISSSRHQDTADISDLSEYNARPQIVIGLVDGERLGADNIESNAEWLQTTAIGLQQSLEGQGEAATGVLVVLGGSQHSSSDNIYFVDLDGDGPSLLDVIEEIVTHYIADASIAADDIRQQISAVSVPQENTQSPSSNATGTTPEVVRSPPSRVDSPAVGAQVANTRSGERNTTVENMMLLAQLNLQAGQWPEALRCFSEAAIDARNRVHQLWHAKALEGLLTSMLLHAWAHLNFAIPQICYSSTDRKGPVYNSPSMSAICAANRAVNEITTTVKSSGPRDTLTMLVPQLLSYIICLYERATGIHQDSIHFEILARSRLRWGSLLLIMKQHGGTLDDAVLEAIVENRNSGFEISGRNASAPLLVLHTKVLTKFFMDTALEAQSKLPVRLAAPIQVTVASILSKLKVERKQAFHLREFLHKLGPALVEARRAANTEVSVHRSAGSIKLSPSTSIGGKRTMPSIRSLLESICGSYGLLRFESGNLKQQPGPKDCLQSSLRVWSAARQTGDISLKLDILRLCIVVSDAIPDFHSSLDHLSQLLLVAIGRPTLYANNSNSAPLISSNEQAQLLASMHRTTDAAMRQGTTDARATYWDKFLVRLIDLSEVPGADRLIPRTPQDISLVSHSKGDVKKDPFIFNPFAKAGGPAGQSIIVAGEQARFEVILQNPLQVEIEVEDITLTSQGCDFQPDHHSIILGPLCSQVFTLSGKALTEGTLTITGCKATVRDCHPEEFLIVVGDWKMAHSAKQSSGASSVEDSSEVQLPEIKQLSVKVIAPLPTLSVASTSLLQHTVMLLEGETTRFKVNIQNTSSLDVDFVLITFEDSVTKRLEEALNNKDLLPADLYEIQDQIANRPVVRLVNDDEDVANTRIPAQEQTEFILELFGRPGLVDISILVDYASLGKSREEVTESFYTRQLRHTIKTTVNASIDIPRCVILPLHGSLSQTHKDSNPLVSQDSTFSAIASKEDYDGHCLLLLDVRNIWPQPLDVTFVAGQAPAGAEGKTDEFKTAHTVAETLQPGHLTRLLLVVSQILVNNPYTPVPSLDTKRQFVVSASKMTLEAEAASRESFWYREHLLTCLRATWKEPGGGRSGSIDMRKGIRLSSRMIDALRIDLVEILFSFKILEPEETDAVIEMGTSHFSLKRNSFACLVTKVRNRSNEDMRLLLRLQPSLRHQPHNIALDLSKRFAWTGVLQKALHPPLKPGETREVELGIIALAEGEYDVNGTAEEIECRSSKSAAVTAPLGNGFERRIWHARRPCMIDVVDDGS